MEISQLEQQTENQTKKKIENNVRDLWDNTEHANLHKIKIPERE